MSRLYYLRTCTINCHTWLRLNINLILIERYLTILLWFIYFILLVHIIIRITCINITSYLWPLKISWNGFNHTIITIVLHILIILLYYIASILYWKMYLIFKDYELCTTNSIVTKLLPYNYIILWLLYFIILLFLKLNHL